MISEEKAESLFADMDEDNSGGIEWEEFRRFFSTKRRISAEALGLA